MIHQHTHPRPAFPFVALLLGAILVGGASAAWAEGESTQSFKAVATDAQGLETDLDDIIFYWEETVSETSFIPHELRELPVKRGTSTVKIKFDSMKQIELKASGNGAQPQTTVTLKDGKSADFTLAVAGSFRGQSAFGEVELPAAQLSRVVFK